MGGLELLQSLLRIDTTNPPGKEAPAAELIEARLKEAGLETTIYTSPEGRPNLVARLEGPADRGSLVLLSHTDVVGVEADSWEHDPFGGEVHDGFVWGRGALDMKSIAVMHAEAAAALATSENTPAREVIVVAVADEEAGGSQGVKWLLGEHADAVGFSDGRPPPEVIGEGGFGVEGIIDAPIMPIVLGEKTALWVRIHAEGDPGHGSTPPKRNAVANLAKYVARVSGYGTPRVHPLMAEQFRALASATSGTRSAIFKALASPGSGVTARALAAPLRSTGLLGALLSDTATPTRLEAGYKENVVPGEASGSLDCRLLPDTDPFDFLAGLNRRGTRYGVRAEAISMVRGPVSEKGAFYSIAARLSQELRPGIAVVPSLSTGFTDVAAFRELGAHGYGWVPLVLPRELIRTIHGHNERIAVQGFEAAVDTMARAVKLACS